MSKDLNCPRVHVPIDARLQRVFGMSIVPVLLWRPRVADQ